MLGVRDFAKLWPRILSGADQSYCVQVPPRIYMIQCNFIQGTSLSDELLISCHRSVYKILLGLNLLFSVIFRLLSWVKKKSETSSHECLEPQTVS